MDAKRSSLVMVLGLWSALASAQPAEKVGNWGDWQRIVVHGATAFTPDAVKMGLAGNLDLQFAAHPAAPLGDYLRLLGEKTTFGYQRSGFPDVKVQTRLLPAEGRVLIEIEEGPRYVAGEIQIEGADRGLRKTIHHALATSFPPAGAWQRDTDKALDHWVDATGKTVEPDEPVWPSGKPASFLAEDRKKVIERTEQVLEGLGHFGARYETTIVPDLAGRTALLKLQFQDLGPKAVVGEIVVKGNSKNSQREILDYLGLRQGMPITSHDRQRMQERLWASGRFLTSDVQVTRAATGGRVEVRINVSEYAKAPRLAERLSREDETLLKCCRWLRNADGWQGDLVVRVLPPGVPTEFIFSPRRGLLVRTAIEAGGKSGPAWTAVALVTPDGRNIYRPFEQRKVIEQSGKSTIIAGLGVGASNDVDKPFRYICSLWTTGETPKNSPPVKLYLTFEPVAFLGLSREYDTKCKFLDDKMLVIVDDQRRITIDTATGRLREFRGCQGATAPTAFRVTFEPGAFAYAVKEIEGASASFRNEWDSDLGFFSFVRFLTTDRLLFDVCQISPPDPAGMAVAWKVFQRAVWAPYNAKAEMIPATEKEKEFHAPDALGSPDYVNLARLCLFTQDFLLPRQSWPWMLGHEAVWVWLGKHERTGDVLRELWAAEDAGPVRFLAMAYLVSLWDQRWAATAAEQGLRKLNAADFRHDYAFLFDHTSPGQCDMRWVEEHVKVVRSLNAQEVQSLARLLPPADAKYILEGVRILQEQPQRPVDDALPAALDAMWKAGLQDRVGQALFRLAGPSPSPTAP